MIESRFVYATGGLTLGGRIITTLPYFPNLLPGELIYSVLARLRRHTGSMPSSTFLQNIFNAKISSQNIALPTRIAALVARIPSSCHIDASKLIHNHTFSNYYARFAPSVNREAAFRSMLDGTGMAQKDLRVSISIPGPSALRFCPQCQITMMAKYGELYWRREHQIPAVLMCPFHGCELRNSTVNTGHHVRDLFAASIENCSQNSPALLDSMSRSGKSKLLKIAKDCLDILEGSSEFDFGKYTALDVYQRRLADGGYLTINGKRVLNQSYSKVARFELEYLKPIWPRLFVQNGECGEWLRRMNHGQAAQDTTFMLLGLRVTEIITQVSSKQDKNTPCFGKGHWPCRNLLSENFGKLTIDKPLVRSVADALTAKFSCRCGYIYMQRRCQDGSLMEPRLSHYGESLRPFICNALAMGWTAGLTARKAGIGTSSLICQAKQIGIETPWVIGKMRKPRAQFGNEVIFTAVDQSLHSDRKYYAKHKQVRK